LTRSPPTRASSGGAAFRAPGQARRVGRVVLAVAVQGDDDGRAGGQHAAAHGAALARVLAVAEHPQLRDLGFQGDQQGLGLIPAGVVDEDDLVGLAREGGGDLARQGRRRAALVENGHDDGIVGESGSVHRPLIAQK
jgi:hypothetical protein